MSAPALTLHAPAKINWTLEVLGRRPDGYHEVRTVLQTINLYDSVGLSPASDLTLSVRGATRGFRRASQSSPEDNLAFRAAALLRERTGCRRGAEIHLGKHIPVAAGLGGGSSDAATVLLGLSKLWDLSISDGDLASLAAELGSDAPFFLQGGTAAASGRGELLEPLPDGQRRHFVLAWPKSRPPVADKTARMYAALRSEHYTDGSRSEALAARLRAGNPVRDDDCYNVFEAVLAEVDPKGAELLDRVAGLGLGRPHLCGSGPAVYLLVDVEGEKEATRRAWQEIAAVYGSASLAMTITAAEALGGAGP